mmetsp:Transcript_51954/g.104508  ORF Transcript_51954/g.104508 Transcript_51954/m.104508 type:complete len:233 (-) Transcript_51954:156-854(-)
MQLPTGVRAASGGERQGVRHQELRARDLQPHGQPLSVRPRLARGRPDGHDELHEGQVYAVHVPEQRAVRPQARHPDRHLSEAGLELRLRVTMGDAPHRRGAVHVPLVRSHLPIDQPLRSLDVLHLEGRCSLSDGLAPAGQERHRRGGPVHLEVVARRLCLEPLCCEDRPLALWFRLRGVHVLGGHGCLGVPLRCDPRSYGGWLGGCRRCLFRLHLRGMHSSTGQPRLPRQLL